jgi:DNA-binding SARP family transcriptional activator
LGARLRFGVLGPVTVAGADSTPVPVESRVQRTLLAVLLCHPSRPVGARTLNVAVWGADAPTTTDGLRVHLSRLRRIIGDGRLSHREGGYLLEVRPDELDAALFRKFVDEARAVAADDARAARDLLRRALALWRGPAFADLETAEPVRNEAAMLEELRADASERCFELELALGRHVEVAGEIRALAAAHPYREELRRQLMLALYRGQRRAEALEVYEDTRRMLAEELGVDPSPQLRDLHARMLRDEATLAVRPAIAVAAVPPSQVPAAPADFTGRRAYLHALDLAAGADDTAVVVALVGMAGVGKSALAAHWARQARDRFPDGQLYINLRGYAPTPPVRPINAIAGFLRSLGIAADQLPHNEEEAAGLYRTILDGRRLLVLLDNAHRADQVRPLLPGSPGCMALVTSRDRLTGLVAIDAARRIALDVLDDKESTALLRRALGDERVDREPDATAALAGACGHLPLALRIAAANLADERHGSVADYLEALRSRRALENLQIDGDHRSSVRRAFDLSYTALDPATRRCFRLLALAPGPDLTTGAVAALDGTQADHTTERLALLARTHLVVRAAGRWSMHDLIRAYGAERGVVEDGQTERVAALARLYGWLLGHVDAAARLRYPQALRLPGTKNNVLGHPAPTFADPIAAKAWLDSEISNLSAAVMLAATDETKVMAYRIADALRNYFLEVRDRVNWLAIARAGLAAAEGAGHELAQAAMHHFVGDALYAAAEPAATVEHFEHALRLAQRNGWWAAQASLLGGLGIVHGEWGRLREAIDYHRAALRLQHRVRRPSARGIALGNIGMLLTRQGNLSAAVRHLTRSLASVSAADAGRNRGITLVNFGHALRYCGRFTAADERLAEAEALFSAMNDATGLTIVHGGRAALYCDTGRFDLALDELYRALEPIQRAGDRRREAVLLTTLGTIHCHTGDTANGIDTYRSAAAAARAVAARFSEACALAGIAGGAAQAGDSATTLSAASSAVEIARTDGYRIVEGDALCAAATAHVNDGAYAEAVASARIARSIQRRTGCRLGYVHAQLLLEKALRACGCSAEADSCAHAASQVLLALRANGMYAGPPYVTSVARPPRHG